MNKPSEGQASPGRRGLAAIVARTEAFGPTVRGMLWAAISGLSFSVLNASMRAMALELDPLQTQFLRYFFGLVVLLPLVLRSGIASFRPNRPGGHLVRGVVHTVGMFLWFTALPRIPLADTTAIGFTTPIFIMVGAALLLGERMVGARWVAAGIGFIGVMIVIAPKLSGSGGPYALMMLASAPVFAASFLIAKVLTRDERPEVIVLWQALSVTVFTLPAALMHWSTPTPQQWLVFLAAGALGSFSHYCLNRAYRAADISATQPVKFLDLIWASTMGFLLFGNLPTGSTLAGAAVIFASTLWIARREARHQAVGLPR